MNDTTATPMVEPEMAELAQFEPYNPDVLDGHITRQQFMRSITAVAEGRIEVKQGLSYIPQQEVRAELTRTYGPGRWDSQVISEALIYETQQAGKTESTKGKMYWTVAYRVGVRLRVRDYHGRPIAEFIEYHAEENAPQPNRGEAHALALTSAASYALRRCAIGLGDNFGLHLYNKGSLEGIIKGSLYSSEYLKVREPLPARKESAPPQEAHGGAMPDSEDKQGIDPAAAAEAAAVVAQGFAHPDGRTE